MTISKTTLALALLVLSAWPRRAHAQGFTVSTTSGLEAVRDTRAADWWLSGASLIDLDGDGDLDLFLSSHGSYGSLTAINDGKGHFSLGAGTFPKSELLLPADVDGDGKADFSATYADGGAQWWLNRATAPGAINLLSTMVIRDGGLARQQALVDLDGDGKIDWLRGGRGNGVLVDLGDGKGGFANLSRTIPNPGGEELAIIPCDFDGDGDPDLLLEWGRYDTYGPDGASRLLRNDGGGTFTDVTTAAGLYETGLAVQGIGDFDQDGDTDIIALEKRAFPHTIFLNDGHGVFTKKAGAVTGLPAGTAHYGSWGLAAMTDLDNDGIADVIVDGRNYLHVLRGTGGGAFVYANKTWGGIVDTAEAAVDAGFTFGDLDGDGDLDLIGYKTIDPRYLNVYVNALPAQKWVDVRVVGADGNRAASGAEISVYAAGTTQLLWYEQVSIYSKQVQQTYYARGETERHYGLGARTAVDVAVKFHPSNKLVRTDGVAASTIVRLAEDGAGTIVPPLVSPVDAGTAGAGGGGAGGTASGGASGLAGATGAAGATMANGGAGGTSAGGDTGAPGAFGDAGAAGAAGASGAKVTGGSGGCACGLTRSSPRANVGVSLFVWLYVGAWARRRARKVRP